MIVLLFFLPFLLSGCWSKSVAQDRSGVSMITVKSSAFDHQQLIPSQYTCDGQNYSPDLSWSGVPDGTKSLVLLCDDPDASPDDPADPATVTKTWVHWVVFNLPPDLKGLSEKVSIAQYPGAVEGTNSFGKTNYGGPCPPKGTHRYFFKVYALDVTLSLDSSATNQAVLNGIKGHVLAEGSLMGRYKRQIVR